MRRVLVGIALAGCGAIAPEPPAKETPAHTLARVACDKLRDCCVTNRGGFDPATCLTDMEGDIQLEFVWMRGRDIPFHEQRMQACEDALGKLVSTCDRTWDTDVTLSLWVPECGDMFTKDQPLGTACETDRDCASGRCRGRPKQCASLVPQLGDSCESGYDCRTLGYFDTPPALRCDRASHRCATPLGEGQTCTDSTDCDSATYCPDGGGRCTWKVGVGQSCSASFREACRRDAWCDDRCKPRRENGATCDFDEQCQSNACGGTCAPSRFTTIRYCGAPREVSSWRSF